MEITAKVNYDLNWSYSVSIERLKQDIEAIEQLGATHVEIVADVAYDCPTLSIEAVCEREETEQEANERLAIEKARSEAREQEEIRRLKELKAKYPNV